MLTFTGEHYFFIHTITMALPSDNIWLVRQNYLASLRDVLLKNVTFLNDFIAHFDEPTVITESKLIEYSKQANVYAKTFGLVYGYLYEAAEFEEASIEVNGLPQDVETLLVAGLRITTQGLSLAEVNAGTWVSAIYNSLLIAKADIDTINSVLSWLQYGMNTWDTAKQLTFPEPPPQFDEVPDDKRTPNRNMVYDWELQVSEPICSIRGMLFNEEYSYKNPTDATAKLVTPTKDLLLGITIGEGATTSTTKITLESNPQQLRAEKCIVKSIVNIYDVETGDLVDFINYKFDIKQLNIPILTKAPDQDAVVDDLHFEYGAALEINQDGSIVLFTWNGKKEVDVVNHATYSIYIPCYLKIQPADVVEATADEPLQKQLTKNFSGSSVGIISTEEAGDPLITSNKYNPRLDRNYKAILSYYDKRFWSQALPNITYGVSLWGVVKVNKFAYASNATDLKNDTSVPTLYINANNFANKYSFSGTLSLYLEYVSSDFVQDDFSTLSQFIQIRGKLNILIGGTLESRKEYKLVDISKKDNPDNVWGNIYTAPDAEPVVVLGYFKGCEIRYRYNSSDDADLNYFFLVNTTTSDITLKADDVIYVDRYFLLTTSHMPIRIDAKAGGALTRIKLGYHYDTQLPADITTTPEPIKGMGIFANYYPSFSLQVGDVVKAEYSYTSVASTIKYGYVQGVYPADKVKPKVTQTFSNFIFNIFCEDNFLITYEFVLRTKAWKQGKAVLFSRGAISTDFIPGQHLVIQLGAKSYIVVQNDGSAVIQWETTDLEKLEVGDRFICNYPSIPLIKAKAYEKPKETPPVTLTPGLKPGASLLPYFGIDISKALSLGDDPVKPYPYYEWSGLNLSQFTRAMIANVVNLVQDYDSSDKVAVIIRYNKTADNVIVKKEVISTEDFNQFIGECQFNKDTAPKCKLYTADGVGLYMVQSKFISEKEDPESGKRVTEKWRFAFRIAQFPWAFDLIKNIKKDAETLAIGLTTLLSSWDSISKYDYFKSIIEHNKQFGIHLSLIADLMSRIDSETRGAKNDLATNAPDDAGFVKSLGRTFYEAWNNRWNNL